MSFPWFTVVRGTSLEQGDIIKSCYTPQPQKSVYESVLNNSNMAEIDIKIADIIILSQSCDLENNKIKSVITSPIWDLKKLIEVKQHFKSSNARDSLRQGKEPSYHLINEYRGEEVELPFSVVDFHQIHSLPKDFLEAIAEKNSPRLRLLPPYKENLAQAFARYFMRVGLPQNIDREKLTSYAK